MKQKKRNRRDDRRGGGRRRDGRGGREDGGCARASVGRAGTAVPGEASWFRKVHRPPDRASLAACDPACSSVVS